MTPPTAMAERPTAQTRTELSDRVETKHPSEDILKKTASIYTAKGDDLVREHGKQMGECFAHIERCRPCTDKYQAYMTGSRSTGNRNYGK